MEKYDLVSIPVVDRAEKLVGRITIDDIVDLIKEEADNICLTHTNVTTIYCKQPVFVQKNNKIKV